MRSRGCTNTIHSTLGLSKKGMKKPRVPKSKSACNFETDHLSLKLRITLAADRNAVDAVVQQVMGIVREQKCIEGKEDAIELALTEALANAVKVDLGELTRPNAESVISAVTCPCNWKAAGRAAAVPVAIPRYNNENRWYIEKYQSIVSLFEQQ